MRGDEAAVVAAGRLGLSRSAFISFSTAKELERMEA
jgi:hypothetical protein